MQGKTRVAALVMSALLAFATGSQASTLNPAGPTPGVGHGEWVGTWGTAPAGPVPGTDNGYPNYSIRNVIHSSVGGSSARVRLSNAFGVTPLVLGHVSVAVRAAGDTADAVPGSVRELTFGGSGSVIVPAGADVQSDAVWMPVPADADLLVTTFTPEPSGPVTYHPAASETSFFTRDGDHVMDDSGAAYGEQTSVWHYVTEVDVRGSGARGSIVTFGDSITDGVGSTSGANHRWPDYLADRLAHGPRHGVLNSGISANRMLLGGPGNAGRNALARLNDDLLTRTAPRTVILMEGINDIQQEPHQTDPAAITSAYEQFVTRAHSAGIRVVGATLTPFKGWHVYDETLEATRLAVNHFIRTSGLFDSVVDFDAVLRDPADPLTMRPEFDSGDHLHPGDAGYRAMADAVNLGKL